VLGLFIFILETTSSPENFQSSEDGLSCTIGAVSQFAATLGSLALPIP
jgi:hypothetical protein